MADKPKGLKWGLVYWGGDDVDRWESITIQETSQNLADDLEEEEPLLRFDVNGNYGRKVIEQYAKMICDALNTKDMIDG